MQATLPPLQTAHFAAANNHLLLSPPISPTSRVTILPGSTPRRQNCDDEFNALPKDPRQWSREHVQQWLLHMSKTHNLSDVQHTRFLMNGKALCLMSPSMFINRVPLGGKLLYKDFQLRLSAAMHSASSA